VGDLNQELAESTLFFLLDVADIGGMTRICLKPFFERGKEWIGLHLAQQMPDDPIKRLKRVEWSYEEDAGTYPIYWDITASEPPCCTPM